MLQSVYGPILDQVKETYKTLESKVWKLLIKEKNKESGTGVLEDEIFDTLNKLDETYLHLLIEQAFENYLHNQQPTDMIKYITDYNEYIPSEDIFLRLTLYVDSRIIYLRNKDDSKAYTRGRRTFESLRLEMETFIDVHNKYKENINGETEYSDECEYMFTYLKNLNPELIDELYIYLNALLDQLGDRIIHVFTIGEKLDREYSAIKLLEIVSASDIIKEYKYSLYKAEKEKEESQKQRSRNNFLDGELPFEI